jgi:DNA invertase Pin-like site-specific DNA recombinase
MSDFVYLRVSLDAQDEERQRKIVRDYLRAEGIDVPPPDHWRLDKEKRHLADKRSGFQWLLGEVERLGESGEACRIFMAEQDRFGTTDGDEWGHYRYRMRRAGCQLIECVSGRDLTAPDTATRITTGLAADQSEREQILKGTRALSGKVSKAKDSACWNGGTAPYGFDKAVIGADGTPLYFVHYLARSRGAQVFPCERCRTTPRGLTGNRPCPDCRRVPVSVAEGTMPHKDGKAGQRVTLIPSEDQSRIDLVLRIFWLYVRRRESATGVARLIREEGGTIYGRPVVHENVDEILKNPAYRGAYAFGRRSLGRFADFDGERVRELPSVKGKRPARDVRKPPEKWIVKEGQWPGLVDEETWKATQKKLAACKKGPRPPRTKDAWLKGILFCGTCRKPMIVRRRGGTLGYSCLAYHQQWTHGNEHGCGFNRVTHAEAVRIITRRLAEMKISLESDCEREAILSLYATKGRKLDDVARLLKDGALEYVDLLLDRFAGDGGGGELGEMIREFRSWFGDPLSGDTREAALDFAFVQPSRLEPSGEPLVDVLKPDPAALARLMGAIEKEAAACATRRLAVLRADLKAVVESKMRATSERERAILNARQAEIEARMDELDQHAKPLGERYGDLMDEVRTLSARIEAAEAALAEGENMHKAEAVRLALGRVYLHFDQEKRANYTKATLLPERTEFETSATTAGSS